MRSTKSSNELVHHPIDLSPLVTAIIKAGAKNDWAEVSDMLNNGYSLLWLDAKEQQTVMRKIASDAATCHLVPKLLDLSIERNGKNSQAHQFVVLEASIGSQAILGKLNSIEIAERSVNMQKYYEECDKLAQMHCKDIDHLVFETDNEFGLPPIKPSADTVYHLCCGGHYERARDHLEAIGKVNSDEDLARAVRSYIKGMASPGYLWWLEMLSYLRENVTGSRADFNVLNLVMAEAITTGNEKWVLEQLDSELTENADDYAAELFGEAIISAARIGRTDILLKLSELARKKKLDKLARYQLMLGRAAGAAVVSDYFPLAKVIMLMSPKFAATPNDMIELHSWPVEKIKRFSRAINDYKLFTDIARNVVKDGQDKSWVAVLKEEYGLKAMSDEGFLCLLEHPEGLQKLFFDESKKCDIADQFTDEHLAKSDIDEFRAQMSQAKEQARQPDHGKISFFRLRHLARESVKELETPDVLQHALQIKNEIAGIFGKFESGIHFSKTKQAVMACGSALNKAHSPDAIKKVLSRQVKPINKKLYEDCMAIFHKHLPKQASIPKR